MPLRVPVGETLAVADAIVQAASEERVGRFVGAVDVVGNEKKVPTWLYAIAYQRIAGAKTCRLEFACHAGEYFTNRIEGLRRIAEVALFRSAEVRRIGHCLALAADSGTDVETPNGEAGSLLESLAWSLLVLDGRPETRLPRVEHDLAVKPELVSKLKRVLLQLAGRVFGSDVISVDDIQQWYVRRFEIDTMARWLPELVAVAPEQALAWPRGMSGAMIPPSSTLLEAMLTTALFDITVDVATPAGMRQVKYCPSVTVPRDLSKTAGRLLEDVLSFALPQVRGWLIQNEIVIESCPSSNAALAELPIATHPIWQFHNDGLRCSVNTDDPALFGASLSEEYVHAGMVAQAAGGDGGSFVASLAHTSRTTGMIQRPLCESPELPLDVYRALAA